MANDVPLLVPETRWSCPNCVHQDITRVAEPHTRMHPCRGSLGMLMPMVRDGTRCKVELVERQDYIGTDVVQLGPDGRPYMAAVTTRSDGCDVAVYAPLATVNLRR